MCYVFSNVSTLAQAQAAPLMNDGASRFGGGDNVCQHCGKAVYFAEQALGGNKVGVLFVFFHTSKLILVSVKNIQASLAQWFMSLSLKTRGHRFDPGLQYVG